MTTHCIRLSLLLTIALTIAVNSPALADDKKRWLPDETPAQHDARMAWFRQGKFGMFVHWGIYSIPADGEWHMRSKKQTFTEYSKFAAQFNPLKFDANQWAALAHDAGMKYMVLTTKHHDGFAMFKSAASDYNVADATPFKRDVVKELAEACPKHGIRFGTYYSFVADWGHKGGGSGGPHWDPALQGGDLHTYVHDIAIPQMKELLGNYGPLAVMWFDSDGSTQTITPEESAEVVQALRTQPQMLVNPRLAGINGDYGTSEVDVPLLIQKRDWELCVPINPSWGYTPAAAKPLKVLLPYIIDAWGKGGNVLLNVGPTSEGIIPEDSTARLREIGQWLGTYGDTIYGSTAGPFEYLPWGTATRKGDTLYLQVCRWPTDGQLKVPLSNKVRKAILLGAGEPRDLVTSHDNPNRVIVKLPAAAPDPVVNVVALTLEGEPKTDYHSVLLNCPVKASANQAGAALSVDDNESTAWDSPDKTGWLEFNLPKPMTVASLRMSAAYHKIGNLAFEYKDGDAWKPIMSGEKIGPHQYAVIKEFAPVTAQTFRVSVLESEDSVRIKHVELFPPL